MEHIEVVDGGLGNANETPLLDIYNGVVRRALAKALDSPRIDDKPEKCRNCIALYDSDTMLEDANPLFGEERLEKETPSSYTYQYKRIETA